MHVYMVVTDDIYEFPLVIADTAQALADKVGTTKNSVLSAISHAKAGRSHSRFVKVEWEDEEDDW